MITKRLGLETSSGPEKAYEEIDGSWLGNEAQY